VHVGQTAINSVQIYNYSITTVLCLLLQLEREQETVQTFRIQAITQLQSQFRPASAAQL